VVGPTASGKSALALAIAERVGGEILCTDSMQVYRHLDIGTGKPGPAERARIPHHLIDVADPDEAFSAGRYVEQAQAVLAELARRGRVPILCGGTGLYFKALLRGLAPVPPVPAAVRREVGARAAREGLAASHAELRRVDPESAARIHAHDLVRILRALEVYHATGRPLSRFQRDAPFRPSPEYVLSLGIAWERRALRARIAERVRAMLAAGWVEEVRRVLEMGYSPRSKPLQAIGYREIREYLDGEREAASLAPAITLRTQQYAKRQVTWFRRHPGIVWAAPGDEGALIERALRFVEAGGAGAVSEDGAASGCTP
jgi:tRNA dimethylallyltransferase